MLGWVCELKSTWELCKPSDKVVIDRGTNRTSLIVFVFALLAKRRYPSCDYVSDSQIWLVTLFCTASSYVLLQVRSRSVSSMLAL